MANNPSSDFATLHEVVQAAKGRLDEVSWDYLVGGGGSEVTLARNRLALDSCALRPRVLRDVSKVDPGTVVFGKRVALPVALAPVGSVDSFDPVGVGGVAAVAGRFGAAMICGGLAVGGMEAVAARTAGPKIYQAYITGGDPRLEELSDQAAALGYDAFCLTVDAARSGRRERDIAKRFVKPWAGAGARLVGRPTLTWADVERFKACSRLPLILKGIGTAEDALLAIEHGVEVVYVSNHGGRQLDQGLGTLDILPEVVEAVGGRAQVWIDGGFCRGTDVVKALALGADVVGIGRLYLYGLAAAGEAGLERVLDLLLAEVCEALALCGLTDLTQLDKSFVTPAISPRPPSVLSAFPLLPPGFG